MPFFVIKFCFLKYLIYLCTMVTAIIILKLTNKEFNMLNRVYNGALIYTDEVKDSYTFTSLVTKGLIIVADGDMDISEVGRQIINNQ